MDASYAGSVIIGAATPSPSVDVGGSVVNASIQGLALAITLIAVQALSKVVSGKNGSTIIDTLPTLIHNIGSHVRRVEEVVHRIEDDHKPEDGVQTWKIGVKDRSMWGRLDDQQRVIIVAMGDLTTEVRAMHRTIREDLVNEMKAAHSAISKKEDK